MLPEALLVCSDVGSARALLPVLEELGIKVERHHDAMAALTRLWTWRYDAVIVDCEGGGDEAEVVREVREVGQNRTAVTIAIIGESEDADIAYSLGAHFVMQKPLTSFRVRRMMRAAHALIHDAAQEKNDKQISRASALVAH
jgi:DNA-binding response OmpR family regulator